MFTVEPSIMSADEVGIEIQIDGSDASVWIGLDELEDGIPDGFFDDEEFENLTEEQIAALVEEINRVLPEAEALAADLADEIH